MIPAFRPAAFFGRSGRPAAPINHVAFGGRGSLTVVPDYHTSEDGAAFIKRRMRGDVTWYTQAGSGLPGAFQPPVFRQIGSKLFLGGRLTDGGNPARAALFVSDVRPDPVWHLVPTGIEGPKGTGAAYHTIVGIDANDTYIAVISSFGNVAVSTDGGDTFTGYGSMGFSGPTDGLGFVNGLAASAWGFVAVGEDGQIRTATDPRSTWTARTSQFGDTDINGVIAAGSLFIAFGLDGKISTATIGGPTSWTARSSGTSNGLDLAIYTGTRTFIGGSGGTWLVSLDGTSWSAAADTPFKGESSRPRSAYMAGSDIFVHWGDGKLSKTSDEATWTELTDNGLTAEPHFAAGYIDRS